MTEQTSGSGAAPLPLPEKPNIEWLRGQAKRLLEEIRKSNPDAKLADAQFHVARLYGFASWRAMKAQVDALAANGDLIDAAKTGDVATLAALLDREPGRMHARSAPYEWTLLHLAAQNGHLAVVDLLLKRGMDPNVKERGDRTYPLHWAAAAGHVEVVRRLIEAGGDVVGHGDDHELEVIGWATCWDGQDTATHHAVVDLLLAHGAEHHIFSAIAMNLADEVRRIVAADPSRLHARMSRNENHRLPLQFAVLKNRPEMVSLLLDLGADPLGVDGSGMPAAVYGSQPGADRPVMERIRDMLLAELDSAVRGHRPPRAGTMDLVALLSLGDWDTAARLVRDVPPLMKAGGPANGALHMLAKRNDTAAVKWMLDHGADPSATWSHWDSDVTPLHLAIMENHVDIVRLLLDAGADPSIKDTQHDGNAMDWAQFFKRAEIVTMLQASKP